MALQEQSLYVQVNHPDGSIAPFTRLRVDVEIKNEIGQTISCSLSQVTDRADREHPFLMQYKLKDPNAKLWIVLVVDDEEQRQRLVSGKHVYTFGKKSTANQTAGTKLDPNLIVHIHDSVLVFNDNKEVDMSSVTIGTVSGSIVNIDSLLENVTQNIAAMPVTDKSKIDQLQKLVAELFVELKKVPADHQELAEAVSSQTADVIEKAKQEKPNKTLLQIATQGLKSAAETLKDVAPPVISLAASIAAIIAQIHGIPTPTINV